MMSTGPSFNHICALAAEENSVLTLFLSDLEVMVRVVGWFSCRGGSAWLGSLLSSEGFFFEKVPIRVNPRRVLGKMREFHLRLESVWLFLYT